MLASDDSVMERFKPLFEPRTIAVVGASGKGGAQGNRFIRLLREAGFNGGIYPIHPSEPVIEGLAVSPTLADTPEPIDYAFVAVAAERVPPMLAVARRRVRFAQVMSSGFGESEGGRELENALAAAAKQGGMRLLGPNCMGTYSARGRLTFIEGGIDEPGGLSIMSQSGGLAIDMLQRGRVRGLRPRTVVSLGNCADVGPSELLEYFLVDPQTTVIGAYLEHVANGRSFFEQLRAAKASKPVIILKGARTRQGQRAAASHTGSLADNDQAWSALARQTGAILAETLDDFIDALVAFQMYKPRKALTPSGYVVVFGNGGGASVLATDYLAHLGLDVAPLSAETTSALAELDLPAGASIANPIDVPANVLQRERGSIVQRLLQIIAEHEHPDAILVHLNLGVILGYRDVDMLEDMLRAVARANEKFRGRTHVLLALRSNGDAETEHRKREARRTAMGAGVAVFDEIPNMARAVAAVHRYERFRTLVWTLETPVPSPLETPVPSPRKE
jgi:acyl-CoA synthetase (NDP forming)